MYEVRCYLTFYTAVLFFTAIKVSFFMEYLCISNYTKRYIMHLTHNTNMCITNICACVILIDDSALRQCIIVKSRLYWVSWPKVPSKRGIRNPKLQSLTLFGSCTWIIMCVYDGQCLWYLGICHGHNTCSHNKPWCFWGNYINQIMMSRYVNINN